MAGHHFRRQAPIGPYVVDFVCKKARLVVELDGGRHANRRTYDARRTAYLEARGYRVIRFWNFEVRFEMEGVLAAIFAALADPLPASPCKQGEEI